MNCYSRSKEMFQFSTSIIPLDAISHHIHTQIMKTRWHCKSFCYTIFWLRKSSKLPSAIFHFFTKWYPLNNYEKLFLFHLNSSFRSGDIRIFIFPTSSQFFSVSHCLRGWFKINLKVYDVSNCLNKNLITHFPWYLEKEKRYDIENLSIDTVVRKEHFSGKIMQKLCTGKPVRDGFLILVNNPK